MTRPPASTLKSATVSSPVLEPRSPVTVTLEMGPSLGCPICVQSSTVQYSTVHYVDHQRLQLVLTCGPPPGVVRQWWPCSLGMLMFSTLHSPVLVLEC